MKTPKPLLILFFALLVAQMSWSQTKREILEEDPKLSPNLRFELSPLDFRLTTPFNFGGANVRVAYRANNKFTITGEFRKEYADMEENDNITKGQGDNTLSNPKSYTGMGFEVTGTYYFSSKEKEADQWMPIKSRSIGYRMVEVTVDPVPTTKLNLYGLRAGISIDKGTVFTSGDVSEIGNESNKIIDHSLTPLQTFTFGYAGLSFTRIKNIKVKYPTYGIRRKQIFREVYADLVYRVGMKYENVIQYADMDPTFATFRVDRTIQDNSKIGFRLGILSTPTGRRVNVGYGFEVASLPGGSMGFNIKVLFSLFAKAGLPTED